jgi:hypothetical protein
MPEYAIRVNSSQGAVEVIGPEKDWVDAKLEELSPVFRDYAANAGDTANAGASPKTDRKRAARRATVKKDHNGDANTTTQRRARRTRKRAETNAELSGQLGSELKREFGDWVKDRQKAWNHAQTGQAAIIATFLMDRLQWRGVDEDDLYTVYSAMGWRSPKNIRSQLINARQRDQYFERNLENGKSILSHHGENFARHDSLNTTNDEDAS